MQNVIANQIVSAINAQFTATHELAKLITALWNQTQCPKETGRLIGEAFSQDGLDRNPIRNLADSLREIHGTTKKEASLLLNATGLVSKQRVAQILAVVFDGDKSKNKGKTPAKEAKTEADSFAAIMAILSGKNLSLTEDQADAILAAVASKTI